MFPREGDIFSVGWAIGPAKAEGGCLLGAEHPAYVLAAIVIGGSLAMLRLRRFAEG
jgi:hypothetical protein